MTAGASHPVVAVLLGLAAAGVAGVVVAMAWNVHARQIRLAEQLARRQFIVTAEAGGAGSVSDGGGPEDVDEAEETPGAIPPVVIDGPGTVVAGEQARYRVRSSGGRKVVSWAVGGGSVSQSPDPAHPDELLLIADRPGNLTIIVRVREGMAERRATKAVTAVADVTAFAPPFTLRLFLRGWGLVAVAVLIVGFAGALDALGSLASSDFIALVAPLAALLGVVALARGTGDTPSPPATARPQPGLGREARPQPAEPLILDKARAGRGGRHN
ncbi:MAG: hypothetical protein ACM3ML_34340 [Micromonosporaceae bacterium]